jgi:Putative Ig domain
MLIGYARSFAPDPAVISGSIFPYGAVSEAYAGFTPSFDSGATGGTWSGTNTPSNLSVNSSTGALTGTPDTAATYAFTEKYTDTYAQDSNVLSQSIEITPANIVGQPSDLTGAWWSESTGITTGTADAFRGVTGTKIIETSATSAHEVGHRGVGESYTSGATYYLAAIVKPGGWSSDRLLALSAYKNNYGSGILAVFDLETIAYDSGNSSAYGSMAISGTPTATDLGGGWVFVRAGFTVGTSNLNDVAVYMASRDASATQSFAGDTGHSIHVAWADFYIGA